MCGIAGIFDGRGGSREPRPLVAAMLERLVRRGPDASGYWQDEHLGLGHRRLKILDLSENGNQPMQSRCGRYVIAFNGEIYNFRELQNELGLNTDELASTSDTAILIEAWARWGIDCLARLVGQWAFAVYDRLAKRLWLTRDRFGEKPLFYTVSGGRLAFASTLGALLRSGELTAELDPEAVSELVTLRYVVSPNTVIAKAEKLPAGTWLAIDPGGVSSGRWFQLQFTPGITRPQAELVDEFDGLFRQAVRRCTVSDVPLALLLSDGIDSQAIAAVTRRMACPLPAITYEAHAVQSELAGLASSSDDPLVTRLLLKVSPEERIARMGEAFAGLNEPVGDGAALATWFLISKARDRATVFLCGHGADEVLGGYRLSQERFRLQAIRRLAWLPPALTHKALDRFLFGAEPLLERRRSMREASAAMAPQAARYLIHRPLPPGDLAELRGPGRAIAPAAYLRSIDRLYRECRPGGADLDTMQTVMIHTFLSENILSFADSVAMASSAELRMPFLDRDLINFVARLPAASRVSAWPGRSNTKLILRWWGERYLAREVTRRRKSSFPFGSLRPLMASHRSVLQSYILDSGAVRRALPGVETWLNHPAAYYHGCFQGTLWTLLALGIWCRENGVS